MGYDSGSKQQPLLAEGIRERKKRQTRALISDTATRMFMADGFDAVKVADIARACDVAEKTVYNYFPTKESLLLDREEQTAQAIDKAFGPAATAPPVQAARELLASELDGILGSLPPGKQGTAALRRFIEVLDSAASLRAAQREMDNRLVAVAAAAMARRGEFDPDEPEIQVAAQALLALWRIQFGALRKHTAAGVSVVDGLREKVTSEVTRAARLIESGLGTLDGAIASPGSRPADAEAAAN